jgi:exopolysaccharide biosynthesis polyprenyl glycosylphosphotransferase
MWTLLGLQLGFTIALLVVSDRFSLYSPVRLSNSLHEQRVSAQACLISGLLLAGSLYLLKIPDIPRGIVLLTVALVMAGLGVRRFLYRMVLYRRFAKGIGTRNVLIVGSGDGAKELRQQLDKASYLGFTCKGMVDFSEFDSQFSGSSRQAIQKLESILLHARRHFVDEIFFTSSCESGIMREMMEQAHLYGMDLRVVFAASDGVTWHRPLEYVGPYPSIRLRCGEVPVIGLVFKRVVDILFSSVVLAVLSPLFLLIAVAIKIDSPGPVFYRSERIGKKGRVFNCIKFRTMVRDAEARLAKLMHMNERDGILFKMSSDPRITRLGRFLRKFSLDELPQFFNVLRGDMSVVGPRPPLAHEVREYELSHLRRLDVTPGITGLWQVQGRQDPSFDNYVALDVAYIDNWSIWLDFKIILRTVGVMLAGTGS